MVLVMHMLLDFAKEPWVLEDSFRPNGDVDLKDFRNRIQNSVRGLGK